MRKGGPQGGNVPPSLHPQPPPHSRGLSTCSPRPLATVQPGTFHLLLGGPSPSGSAWQGEGLSVWPQKSGGQPPPPHLHPPTRNLKLGGPAARTLQPHTQPYPAAWRRAPGWHPRAAARLAGPRRTATQHESWGPAPCSLRPTSRQSTSQRPGSTHAAHQSPARRRRASRGGVGLPTPHPSRRPCPPIWLCLPLSICPTEVSAECPPSLLHLPWLPITASLPCPVPSSTHSLDDIPSVPRAE